MTQSTSSRSWNDQCRRSFPTRARGTDTPHLLDLVITDDQFINKTDALAPLGESDHVVLMIETNIFNSECRVEQKFNYNKGDYDALRTYISPGISPGAAAPIAQTSTHQFRLATLMKLCPETSSQ